MRFGRLLLENSTITPQLLKTFIIPMPQMFIAVQKFKRKSLNLYSLKLLIVN